MAQVGQLGLLLLQHEFLHFEFLQRPVFDTLEFFHAFFDQPLLLLERVHFVRLTLLHLFNTVELVHIRLQLFLEGLLLLDEHEFSGIHAFVEFLQLTFQRVCELLQTRDVLLVVGVRQLGPQLGDFIFLFFDDLL